MKPYFISGHGSEPDISGHGSEPGSTMKVPEDCIVIVKTHSGERGYHTFFDGICKLPYDVLQNPLENMPAIIKEFGTVAVYTTGQTCPDFTYQLIACYRHPKSPYETCETYGSGILDLERIIDDDGFGDGVGDGAGAGVEDDDDDDDDDPTQICRKYIPRKWDLFRDLNKHSSYDDIIYVFARKYRHSVNPTAEYIYDVLDSVEAREEIMRRFTGHKQLSMNDKCTLFIRYLIDHKHVVRTQSELKGPAVYYNFLCRSIKGAKSLYGEPNAYLAPFLASPTFHIKGKLIENAVTKKRIEEAELHRKPAIRNYYNAQTRKRSSASSHKRSTSSRKRRSKSTGHSPK